MFLWEMYQCGQEVNDAKKIFEITDYQVNGQDLYDQQILRKEGDL